MTTFRTSLAAAALLTSLAALGVAPAMAETAPANSAPAQTEARHHPSAVPGGMTRGQLVDGRIAFLKAELKITPSQEAQWNEMAAAMRQNANALDQAMAAAHQQGTAMNAVERVTMREQFAKLRADNDTRLLAALKPLYAVLSPPQQETANALIGAHHGGHHGGWRHRA